MPDWGEEWKRANRFLKSAEDSLEKEDIETAANRIYFAAERAVAAILKRKGEKVPEEHKPIWLLSRKINIQTNCYSFLRTLYDLRLQADYGKRFEILELNKENIRLYLEKVKRVIAEIKENMG